MANSFRRVRFLNVLPVRPVKSLNVVTARRQVVVARLLVVRTDLLLVTTSHCRKGSLTRSRASRCPAGSDMYS